MQTTVVDFAADRTIYNITGTTKEELENKLNLFFTSKGYKVNKKEGETTTYQRGNRAARIFLGVFVPFYRVLVSIKNQNDLFSVMVQRDTALISSGGLIGINKSKKEFAKITEAFKEYFAH